jgi:uncharacterized membrane protein
MTALFIAGLLLLGLIILPVIAIVRVRNLERRIEGLEAALLRLMRMPPAAIEPPAAQTAPPPALAQASPETFAASVEPAPLVAAPPVPPPAYQPAPAASESPLPPEEGLEQLIGRRWLGWVAMALLFGAVAYFLKYAFENRWIGELGRVTIGVAAGLGLAWAGQNRYRRGWRYISQALTGGGATILYLSVYGAFAYYHLIDQRAAFIFLAIVVAETHLLAAVYRAPSVAVMSLTGGFLIPLLLSTGRDQYGVLFTYIGLLDVGTVALASARRWAGLGSLSYVGTQILFWGWYGDYYHPEKRPAALAFQAAIFLLFALADLAPRVRRGEAGPEAWIRAVVNPFAFYSICYFLLNDDYHQWMAPLALTLAAVYAALARTEQRSRAMDRTLLALTLGVALTFVTLAIPIQLESNWITMAWAAEGLALVWAGVETSKPRLRVLSGIVFSFAVVRFLAVDSAWDSRPVFTPVFNRYYLGMLALAACLGFAARLSRRALADASLRAALAIGLAGFGVFWLGSSLETYSFFSSRAAELLRSVPGSGETASQLRWAGQLALSLLWSAAAGLLIAAGFRFKLSALRVAGLSLFGITLVKALLVDIAELRQFYRILALLGLGLALLAVAMAYQRSLRREQHQ